MLMRTLVGHGETVVHLGQLKQVFDRARRGDCGLVIGDRQAPRPGEGEHGGKVPQDASLELLLPRLELAPALHRLALEPKRSRILEQAPPPRPPLATLAATPFTSL